MVTEHGQIAISSRFFRNERDNYYNWAFAFWRELFQNSVDAKATKIDIEISALRNTMMMPSGEMNVGIGVRFTDNGVGMSEKVLRDVYFRLGETTKGGSGDLGGFGKARILTCFSHHAYGIISEGYVANGKGSSYSVGQTGDFFHGCDVYVDVDNKDRYNQTSNLLIALQNYLEMSQMNCEVTCNLLNDGKPFKEWMHRRNKVRELSFADVHVNKSSKQKGMIVVRVAGVPMFHQRNDHDSLIVLEISPDKSREVLTSNRDGFNSNCKREFDRFVEEITIDKTSSLKDRKPQRTCIGKANNFCCTVNDSYLEEGQKPTKAIVHDTSSQEAFFGKILSPGGAYDLSRREKSSDVPEITEFHYEESFSDRIPSLELFLDSDDPKMKKAFWLFDPTKNKNYGSTRRKLAVLWAVAVDEAVKELIKFTKQPDLMWRPGFVFESGEGAARAMHLKVEGGHIFSLNPVVESGAIAFSLNNQDDRKRLLTYAVHEVCHVCFELHDEKFANLMTVLFYKTIARWNEINKRMSVEIKSVKV